MTETDLTLDGAPLSPRVVAAVGRGARGVRRGDAVAARMARAREAAQQVAARREVYGRTTGVGANAVVLVEDPLAHDRNLLESHATTSGPRYADDVARATMVVRANQLARGMSGASPAGYDALLTALEAGAVPEMHRSGGLGTGDLGALAELVSALTGGRRWLAGDAPPARLAPGDVLPLLSSNAVTVAEACLAAEDVAALLAAMHATAALTLVAVGGNLEAFDPVVHEARPLPGPSRVARVVRALSRGARVTATRLQDPFGLRAFPQVHGAALDALGQLDAVLTTETAAAAENPLVVAGEQPRVLHHGSWHEAPLALALDQVRLAVVGTATLGTRRLAVLQEPRWTGLPAFLAHGVEGSSGAMALEYVAAAALARLRVLASPVTLGQAVLSRGVEDHASFAPEAARLTTEMLEPLRVVLAAELVAAVRALRLDGRSPEDLGPAPLARALQASYDVLPADLSDRPLGRDLELAETLLPQLAGLARDAEVTGE